MMEHIRLFDWCDTEPDENFLDEEDFDKLATERILNNTFRDPMQSSSESEAELPPINWAKVHAEAKGEKNQIQHRCFVPGIRSIPPYPKVSAIKQSLQYKAIIVLSEQNPHILPAYVVRQPFESDLHVIEFIKEAYEAEQNEYRQWTKSLWLNNHCKRALRPRPPVESAYEARFKVQARQIETYPRRYKFAAALSLEGVRLSEIVHVKDLINVDIDQLPKVTCGPITKYMSIMKPSPVPEPCNRHPCRFVLPNEKTMTELPLAEVHRELAQYAADNGAHCIASESAFRCLVELDQDWQFPVTVCNVFGPDGDTRKVVVFGNEFAIKRESVLVRTYKAFKHLLESFLVTKIEEPEVWEDIIDDEEEDTQSSIEEKPEVSSMDSDDDFRALYIDESQIQTDKSDYDDLTKNGRMSTPARYMTRRQTSLCLEKAEDKFYPCSCKDTFAKPPPRSYKKWHFRDKDTGDNFDVIVHCAHRVRDEEGEVCLEPVPEYQLDVGASEPKSDHIRSLLLKLQLRSGSASLVSVRIDNAGGELVTFEKRTLEEMLSTHEELVSAVRTRIHSACSELQNLRPDHYILQHKAEHGKNAMLYVASRDCADLELRPRCDQTDNTDDLKELRVAPIISTALLPWHKFRRQLPCAFSPNERQVQPPKPARPQKTPPQALKWPKKKKYKKKKSRSANKLPH